MPKFEFLRNQIAVRLLSRLTVSQRKQLKRVTPAAVLILGFATVGAMLLVAAHAANSVTAQEAESGQLNGNASNQTADASKVSGGSFVLFGAGAGGNPNPPPPPPPPPPPGGGGPVGGDGPVDPSDCSATAGDKLSWGEPQYQSNFNTATLDPTWHPYGPEPGNGGQGTRTPDAIKMNGDGTVSINSDGVSGNETTGAMKWFPGQKYGRWEVCLKDKTGNQHYVLITWPDAENYGQGGGELDFLEESGGLSHQAFFYHCGAAETNCDSGSTSVDVGQFHAWAMEWSPSDVTAYVDGQQWYSTSDTSLSPPGSMNLCIQLDQGGSGADSMIVDWAKQWPVQGSEPGTLGLKPGEPSTGQPGSYPDRVPRPLTTQQMRGDAP